jgi:hypothetical protein
MYEDGLPQKDIAQRLGRSPSAVWHLLRRRGLVGHHPGGRNADGEGARQRSEEFMTTAIIGVETSEARWRGISSAAASASCWPSGGVASSRPYRTETHGDQRTDSLRLGESMPCPSCSRRFGEVHADLAPTACRGRSPLARARHLLCAM